MSETVQAHLKKFHARAMKHHVSAAAGHGTAAAVFQKMADGDDDMREHYAKLADQEQAHCDEHASMAEFHKACGEACGAVSTSRKVADGPMTTTKTVPAQRWAIFQRYFASAEDLGVRRRRAHSDAAAGAGMMEHETATRAFFRRYVEGTLLVISSLDPVLAADADGIASWSMWVVFGDEAKLGDFYFELAVRLAREVIAEWKAKNARPN